MKMSSVISPHVRDGPARHMSQEEEEDLRRCYLEIVGQADWLDQFDHVARAMIADYHEQHQTNRTAAAESQPISNDVRRIWRPPVSFQSRSTGSSSHRLPGWL